MNNSESNFKRLEEAIGAIKRAFAGGRDRMGQDLQLTRTQIEILLTLSVKGSLTTGELTEKLGLTQGAVTQTVETLARRDLVERLADDNDRRVVRLDLSAGGRDIASRVHHVRRQCLKLLAEQLTDSEVEALISAATKMAEAVAAFDDQSIKKEK